MRIKIPRGTLIINQRTAEMVYLGKTIEVEAHVLSEHYPNILIFVYENQLHTVDKYTVEILP